MRRATSVYLDVLRCVAAIGVFLGHASFRWFAGDNNRFPRLGHEFVILFFFLSGYVIADATLREPKPAAAYIAARLSRLYSVVGPAVILTAVLWRLGILLAPEFYSGFTRPHEHIRELLTAGFGQELWFGSACPPSNEPLWSLGYEFWYYVVFGCWVFAKAGAARALIVGAAAFVAGPKILLLFPIWLLGVLCWKIRDAVPWGRGTARVGYVLSLGATIALVASGWAYPIAETTAPWFFSGRFISDWLIGMAVGANVLCFDRGFGQLPIPRGVERPIRSVANGTFSLYAYHFAILVFLAATIPYNRSSFLQVTGVLTLALAAIAVLQRLTEAQRPRLRRFIERQLQRWIGCSCTATLIPSPLASGTANRTAGTLDSRGEVNRDFFRSGR